MKIPTKNLWVEMNDEAWILSCHILLLLSMISLWFYASQVTLNKQWQRMSLLIHRYKFPNCGYISACSALEGKVGDLFFFCIKYFFCIKHKNTNWVNKCVLALRHGWCIKNICLTNFLLCSGFTFPISMLYIVRL